MPPIRLGSRRRHRDESAPAARRRSRRRRAKRLEREIPPGVYVPTLRSERHRDATVTIRNPRSRVLRFVSYCLNSSRASERIAWVGVRLDRASRKSYRQMCSQVKRRIAWTVRVVGRISKLKGVAIGAREVFALRSSAEDPREEEERNGVSASGPYLQ
jgi:hypothetical protein